jgi:hypothetical protein
LIRQQGQPLNNQWKETITIMPTITLAAFGKKIEALIGGASVTTATILEVKGTTATIDRETAQAIIKARAAEAAAKTAKERLEKDLKERVGDATEIVVDGEVLFTYKPQVKSVLDGARLKAERFQVWSEYQKEQVTRPLLVRPKIAASLFE